MTAGGVRVRLLGIGGVRGGARRGSCSFSLLVLAFVLVLLVDNHVKLLRSVHSGRSSAVRVAPDAGASAKGILWRWAPPEPLVPPPSPVNFDSDSASVLVGLRKWPERRRLRDLARQDRDLLSPDLGAPSDSRNNKRNPTPQFPPPGHAPTGGFAGCLLIKDDNHLLDEWLAYHSAVLPLRRLLIAIDPMSTQSPFAIIKKWNNTLNLTIDLWTDANYMHGVGLQRICNQWHETNLLKNHRSRQAAFMTSCARHMKEKGMDWTIMIDSDEYLIPNPIADDEEEPPTTLKSERHAKWREDLADARARLPPAITSNATLYDYILAESERGGADSAPWGQRRCILLPRLLFSAIESSGAENDELRELIGHHRIMADSLSTLRFYRHAGKSKASSRMFNKLAKPLLDLSRLDWESDLGTQFVNPVSKNFCFPFCVGGCPLADPQCVFPLSRAHVDLSSLFFAGSTIPFRRAGPDMPDLTNLPSASSTTLEA